MPCVSIIVSCHNFADYLGEALDSILAQSFQDWECIVVDDGSSDGSASIAEAYSTKDKRIRVIVQKNGGVCIARNNGVAASSGQLLLFLDGDDQIMPDFLSMAVPIIQTRPEVKLVYGPAIQFGQGIKTSVLPLPEFSMDTMVGQNCIYITALFRRSDFDRVGGFRREMNAGLEDWDFWLSVLEDGGKVFAMEKPVFRYRFRNGSRNRVISDESLAYLRRQVWERHKPLYSQYFFDLRDSVEYKRLQYYVRKYSSFPTVRLYLIITSFFRRFFHV